MQCAYCQKPALISKGQCEWTRGEVGFHISFSSRTDRHLQWRAETNMIKAPKNSSIFSFTFSCLLTSPVWWWGQPDIPHCDLSNRLIIPKMPAQVHKSLMCPEGFHFEGSSSRSCRLGETEKAPHLPSECIVWPPGCPPWWPRKSPDPGVTKDTCLPVPWTSARASEHVLWSQRCLTVPMIMHTAEIPASASCEKC